jgi:hypothetical protein
LRPISRLIVDGERRNCAAMPRTLVFAANRSAIWIRSCSERYRGLLGLASLIFTGG